MPGYFKLKLRKGAVYVGARILYGPAVDPLTGEALERSWHWAGEINGAEDPDPSPGVSDAVWRIWHSGQRVDEAEFNYLRGVHDWAVEHAPNLPDATPTKPVDWLTTPPLF